MKLVTYQSDDGPRLAGVRESGVVDLNRTDPKVPACIKRFLAEGPEILKRAQAALVAGSAMPPRSVKLLPPVPSPEKIICVGLNYADHAAESGMELPDEPIFFSKFPSSVAADGDPIVLPRLSDEIDYEAELVVVIGTPGSHIPVDRAMEHVAGYCPGNDISARDWQLRKPGGQWLLGKSFDSFAPFGPALVTADEVAEPGNLDIRLRLNGQILQESNTRELIFSIEKLVSYVSDVCTLAVGDLLFTGTPPGVGFARKPPVYLKAGDTVEVEIEGLGTLRNPVVAE